LWWEASIFNYLFSRLNQMGLVYAMRQQWPSPTSSLKGCCCITELELFHGFFYDMSSVDGWVLYVLGQCSIWQKLNQSMEILTRRSEFDLLMSCRVMLPMLTQTHPQLNQLSWKFISECIWKSSNFFQSPEWKVSIAKVDHLKIAILTVLHHPLHHLRSR